MIRKNKILLVMLFSYSILQFIKFLNGRVFFDEGVYIGIAKYFASLGAAGYFESIRPLTIPLILTPFQFLGNSLFFGRAIGLMISLMAILLVYHSAKMLFDKKSALLSAVLFAFSFSSLHYGGYILNDLIAYSLAVTGICYTIKRKYFLASVLIGLGFLSKFPIAILFPLAFLYLLFQERIDFRKIIDFALGGAITVGPYLLFNMLYYEGGLLRTIQPLIDASNLIQGNTWIYAESSILSYLGVLITFEILIIIFFAIGIFREWKNKDVILLLIPALIFLAYFSFKVPRFDMRYAFSLVPFISIVAGKGMALLKPEKRKILWICLLVPILIFAGSNLSKTLNNKELAQVIEMNTGDIVTNTAMPIIYSKSKVNMIPGPNLGYNFLQYFKDSAVDIFVIDIDGYPCHFDDDECKTQTEKRINHIVNNNNIAGCGMFHGTRTIILSKSIENRLGAEECLKSIGMRMRESTERNSVRFSSALINQEGGIVNSDNLMKTIDILDANDIDCVLAITENENSLNSDSANMIRQTGCRIAVSQISNDPASFLDSLRNDLNMSVEIIIPANDEWHMDQVPSGIYECIRAPWDRTVTGIPCRKIDMYTVKDWDGMVFFDTSELLTKIDALKKSDYDIMIDVPVTSLNDRNIDAVEEMINQLK